MEIKEYTIRNEEEVKDLLVELQKFIIEIDDFKLNILSPDYREKYFQKTYTDAYNNEGKIFVALDNNEVLGMIAGYVEQYDEYDKLDYACPKKGVIEELIVGKNARSGGVGTALINAMQNYFISIGCEYCQVDVFAPNENAIKFYKKHNFTSRMITMFKKL